MPPKIRNIQGHKPPWFSVGDRSLQKLRAKIPFGIHVRYSRPVGFWPPRRRRAQGNGPIRQSAVRLPSATTVRPRDNTVTGQPRKVRPA